MWGHPHLQILGDAPNTSVPAALPESGESPWVLTDLDVQYVMTKGGHATVTALNL